MAGKIIPVLGDQLSQNIASLRAADKSTDVVVMAEVDEEATYVKHHKKKIILVFSAMRHFAERLRHAGWNVVYTQIDDPKNTGSLAGEVGRAIADHDGAEIVVTEPGEWRLRDDMESWSGRFEMPVTILDDDRFLCSRQDFAAWADGRKLFRMEHFYREMRRKSGLLMSNGKPAGGQWNFDAENRKPASNELFMAGPVRFESDKITSDVIRLVADRFADHFGDAEPFMFPVTEEQANRALDHFIEHSLAQFGDYQDAMLANERFLYHSVLSPALNLGLLDPLETCRKVEAEYENGRVPINAAEGFVRQVIGWREYVRGIYWLHMPEYRERNYLDADRPLPSFYWTGDTDMACLRNAIRQTREDAYAHHIQRLMITGNFAMLAGVAPNEIHEWYLEVYADAYEWVELPNTLGMSQFADGGLLASKPYAASGNYINKMSNYCADCRYDVDTKTGDRACPFNPLYWDFLARNEKKLRGNRRLKPVYNLWDRMKEETRTAYVESAKRILDSL